MKKIHSILTLALDGGQWPIHPPIALPQKKKSCTFELGGWVGPRAGVYIFGKEKYLMAIQEFEPRIFKT